MAKIFKFLRNFAYAVAGFGLLIIAIGTAEAAGALAVGVLRRLWLRLRLSAKAMPVPPR